MTEAEERRKKIDVIRSKVKGMLTETYPNDDGDNYPRGESDSLYISRQDKNEVAYAIASFLVDFDIDFTQDNVGRLEAEIHLPIHFDSSRRTVRAKVKNEIQKYIILYK